MSETVHKLRDRILFLVVYSLGLRIREGLPLEVTDIDGSQQRVHIRDGKSGKDRYVPPCRPCAAVAMREAT